MEPLRYIKTTAPLSEQMSNLWVYILGEVGGEDIKIGHTSQECLQARLTAVNRDQTTRAEYVLLAGVRATRNEEAALHDYFAAMRREDKGSRVEYFYPAEELVEYAAWLRGQWFAAVDGDESRPDHAAIDPSHWLPTPERRFARPADDPAKLVQDYKVRAGALPGPWAWMPNPTASFQDYYTPPEYVDAARDAMGDIDLDAASHWIANRVHRIPDYFDVGRDAFTHDWHGRVWLNPPYGDNAAWFNRAIEFLDLGAVTQMCMLSPVWAFNTQVAADFMRRVSGMVLLSPTPKFWRNEKRLRAGIREEKSGTNQPHAIVYIGQGPDNFFGAYKDLGIPMRLEWTHAGLAAA